jgi:thiol-disulfide isomerase/thioredoxin
MKNTLKEFALIAATLAGLSTAALGATPSLKVGDPAPKLASGKFVQGDAVTKFQPGKAYIVEFWATWCGPCRMSIPHLNDIYTKYKDKGLVVIGQDCWEKDDSLVGPFVKEMGDKMTYRVALDDKSTEENGAMAKTWMEAAGRHGIPSAFLVGTDGNIAWIGHPMELEAKEDVSDQVLAGKYDIKKAVADYDKGLKAEEAQAKVMAPMQEKMGAMMKAMRAKKWDEALTDLDDAEKLLPEDKRAGMGLNFKVNRFRILLGKKDYPTAYDLGSKIADKNENNSGLLNFLAWQILADKDNDKPNLDLAGKFAERANKAADGKDPSILDTQARLLFMKGQKEAAIDTQSKAIALAEDQQMKTSFQKTLDSYKAGKLPGLN